MTPTKLETTPSLTFARVLWQRIWRAVRKFNAEQIELHERLLLINRPWEEEYLHWAYDGRQWQLHGYRVPPDGRPRSVTSTGWCPGLHDDRFSIDSSAARPES